MAIDICKFETLTPSLFTAFTIPHPSISTASPLRVAVLDTHLPHPIHPPKVAAMIVPPGRERDWIFSTESGHIQLLFNSPGISRLVIVGNVPPKSASVDDSPVIYNRDGENGFVVSEESLYPFIFAMFPRASFVDGFVDLPFLSYEDDVIASVVLEKCVGLFVGEMLVEDIEIEIKVDEAEGEAFKKKREFRRRLRFRRMPNLVQTDMRIVPWREVGQEEHLGVDYFKFQLDLGHLVHPYLGPMAASLKLISECVDEKLRQGIRPKALCVCVGGGALLGFLRLHLGFMVVGIEADEEVLKISKKYFGMVEDEQMKLFVGDGMEELKRFGSSRCQHSFVVHDTEGGESCNNCLGCEARKFDVIMIDLDSDDPMHGLTAPPIAFLQRSVLQNAKLALRKTGILVVNVIPPGNSYYQSLINNFQEIFADCYEIDVGNGENFVLIASVSPVELTSDQNDSYVMKKLRQTNLGHYADQIKKICA